jgi:hypothetical protein
VGHGSSVRESIPEERRVPADHVVPAVGSGPDRFCVRDGRGTGRPNHGPREPVRVSARDGRHRASTRKAGRRVALDEGRGGAEAEGRRAGGRMYLAMR